MCACPCTCVWRSNVFLNHSPPYLSMYARLSVCLSVCICVSVCLYVCMYKTGPFTEPGTYWFQLDLLADKLQGPSCFCLPSVGSVTQIPNLAWQEIWVSFLHSPADLILKYCVFQGGRGGGVLEMRLWAGASPWQTCDPPPGTASALEQLLERRARFNC